MNRWKKLKLSLYIELLKIKKNRTILKEQLIKILIKSCKLMYELNIILKSKKYIM